MKKTISILGSAVLLALGAATFAVAAHHEEDELYQACMNANEPAAEGDAQAEICTCIVTEIGDNAEVRTEGIALSAMTAADRAANASETATAAMDKCIPAEEAAAEEG
jgi:hypothetical protein